MEYLPPANCRISVPVQIFTSSRPFVILPWPSAVNVPMRANKLPCPAHNSVPLIENAYCPLRLAFVNFGGGGGGPPLLPPAPPQAAANSAKTIEIRETVVSEGAFIAHRPAASFARAQPRSGGAPHLSREAIRAATESRRPDSPSARCVPKTLLCRSPLR